ncbi:MAG TPA: hypothetical protein VE988_03935 [Gemmataceae bacterium]|nr:hypothetical protein [Gemmataceae bacterium]
MHRFLAVAAMMLSPAYAHADAFDYYTNQMLAKIPDYDGAKRFKELTPDLLVDHNGVLPDIKASFLVVKTNEGRYSKLLVQPARQKVGENNTRAILVIERFVTYKEGEERTVIAEGKNIRLFQEFQFNLDMGQIVPASIGGDIRLIVTEDKSYLEPIGKAEIYLVTKPLPEATPKKADKVIVGAKFEPKYFDGSYQLFDDGRRVGKLVLKVAKDGFVDGWFYTEKDGSKFQVTGKIGNPNHGIKFKVHFPKTMIDYDGWMFTGDGRAICGTSKIQQRESGFYALRIEE